ncbi:MAG: (d)CMP kinase, partial [Candidatus Poribacteria bacterium]|nr:(d)CMP kinase [Candidatus Poribacteria bacterium]
MTEGSSAFVVAIDGPAGAGKSTVAKQLAEVLGFVHLNSGALYRGVTVLAMEAGVALDNEVSLAELARNAEMVFTTTGRFLLNGADKTDTITTSEVSQA